MIFTFLSNLVYIINLLTIFYMIFKENRSSKSIISWTLVLIILPYVGFILFLILGRKVNTKDIFIMKKSELKLFNKYIKNLKRNSSSYEELKNYKHKDMIKAIESMEYSPYRNDVETEVFFDGKELFEDMIETLKDAKKSINIEFYIFKTDDLGSRILKVLEAKAKEGVEVRLLFDSVGSRSADRKKLKKAKELGVKVGEFFPSLLRFINLNMNFRNHRKIVVIDNKIAYVGGFNVGDEYLGKDPKFGYWRDTHIKFRGDSVRDLNLRFLADWRYATKEDVDLSHLIDYKNEESPCKRVNYSKCGMQIISSGPNPNNLYEIKLSYLEMIQKAKNYIYIQSPYLILDNSIADSLKLASISGVDVKIMIPGKGDHPFVYWANLKYAGELLNFGVKIYHYDKDSFLHSKALVIDDEVCSIGTANTDTRSFELNFEVIAMMYSEEIAKLQRKAFEKDMLLSKELTKEDYLNRSTLVKLKESFSKLFSSLL